MALSVVLYDDSALVGRPGKTWGIWVRFAICMWPDGVHQMDARVETSGSEGTEGGRETKGERKSKAGVQHLGCTYTTPSPQVAPVEEVGMRKHWRVEGLFWTNGTCIKLSYVYQGTATNGDGASWRENERGSWPVVFIGKKKEGIKWSVFWHHHQASRWAENSSHDGSAMIPFLGYAAARGRNTRCPI